MLFVDDDEFFSQRYVAALRDWGFDVMYVNRADAAVHCLETELVDLLIVDMMMPASSLDPRETQGGFHTGLAVARRGRAAHPTIGIIGWSNLPDAGHDSFWSASATLFLTKTAVAPLQLARNACRVLNLPRPKARIFIVHGHDTESLATLKTLLRKRLKVEPIVAMEQSSTGRTVIEQIERIAPTVDAVCVLMTGDDEGHPLRDSGTTRRRARVNVMFELGYFLGLMKRSSGRVVVLRKGSLDAGSDLDGLIYIDISNGWEAAVKQMRRELTDLL